MQASRKNYVMAALLAVATGALAQNNVGEVLDSGGRKLSQAELVPLLSGANMTGDSFKGNGMTINFDYAADGTVAGFSRNAAGFESRSTGTWTVDAGGKFCREMLRQNGQRWGDCRYFFRQGEAYFAAETDERGAAVEKRAIVKK